MLMLVMSYCLLWNTATGWICSSINLLPTACSLKHYCSVGDRWLVAQGQENTDQVKNGIEGMEGQVFHDRVGFRKFGQGQRGMGIIFQSNPAIGWPCTYNAYYSSQPKHIACHGELKDW